MENEKTIYAEDACVYTEGVKCAPGSRHCSVCGHNPKVARERLVEICSKRGIKLPKDEPTEYR